MLNFLIALTVFLLTHMIFSRTALKPLVVARYGMRTYLVAYSLLSLVLLAWLIDAAVTTPRTELWPWNHALYWIPAILMLPACILLIAGFVVANPLSLAPRETRFDDTRPGLIVAITRHPVLWGFALWSGSHLVVNGEFPLALMFAVFLVFALLGMSLVDRQRQRVLGMSRWRQLAQHTRTLPLASPALWSGRYCLTRRDCLGILGGSVAYVALFKLHAPVFGIMPVPPL